LVGVHLRMREALVYVRMICQFSRLPLDPRGNGERPKRYSGTDLILSASVVCRYLVRVSK
jgi:hypothetical protein